MTRTDRNMTGRRRMLAALRSMPVDRPPVWFMRQAGRHLPGYRALRDQHSFLDICRDESLNVEVSAEPWHRYGVDGAIVFNDILTPLRDMGMVLDFAPGPRFERLINSLVDVGRLERPAYGPATDVSRCVTALRQHIGDNAAVLGFIGAPLTVSSFAINGSGVQRRGPLNEAVAAEPELFAAMQEALLPVLVDYASVQVEAGADVIQVFESLADELPEEQYRRIGLPFLVRIIDSLSAACPETPIITFGRGLWPYLRDLARTPSAAISLDDSHDLGIGRKRLHAAGSHQALQGNLPPHILRGQPLEAGAAAGTLLSRWREIVPFPERAAELGPTGWVFNLGHGVPADADPATVAAVVEVLRAFVFSPVSCEGEVA